MNAFLAAFLGCSFAIVAHVYVLKLYALWRLRRHVASLSGPGLPMPMAPIEYPKIDPDDLQTIMIGEMLDNHQIALRKACGCKLCTPFVNLTVSMPSIAERAPHDR